MISPPKGDCNWLKAVSEIGKVLPIISSGLLMITYLDNVNVMR